MDKNTKITLSPESLEGAGYMRRALELAQLGQGRTRPNPMVGAVIVHEGRIIEEGYHHAWDEPHAEVMDIRSVREPQLLPLSTMYVSLEPCSHYGKTPPCASLIIEHRIPRVVVAMLDPYPEVAGRGIALLRAAGVEVEVGLLEAEARRLNAPFVVQHTEARPYIALKWAESSDGFLDAPRREANQPAVVFSSSYRQRIVHRARAKYQAILVGYRTALLDNPSLTNRHWLGGQPVRLVLDPRLGLPASLKLLADAQTPTIVLYDPEQVPQGNMPHYPSGVRLHPARLNPDLPRGVCQAMTELGLQSVLVEGGGRTLRAFIEAGCYDLIEQEVSPLVLGAGTPAPRRL